MAAVALEDIVKKIKPDISDSVSTKVSKLIGIYFSFFIGSSKIVIGVSTLHFFKLFIPTSPDPTHTVKIH